MKCQNTTNYLSRSLLLFLLALGCSLPASAQKLEGIASFYGKGFDGRQTSTGEIFDEDAYSAASLDMPWGTILEVTNLTNGRKTQVRVNDCGPKVEGRLIDLSMSAARDLDLINSGLTRVRLRIIQASNAGPTCNRAAWSRKLKAQGKAIPPPPPPWDPTQTVALMGGNNATSGPATTTPSTPPPAGSIQGMASYYPDRLHGRNTSTGEVYDFNKFTAASKLYPYGTRLEVTNVVSGARTEVIVNDCGPNSEDRILDLSRIAAEQIGVLQAGAAMVNVRVLVRGEKGPTCNRLAWLKAQNAGVTKVENSVLAPSDYQGSVLSPARAKPAAAPKDMVKVYAVQVGAFGNPANAEKMASDLLSKGFPNSYTAPGARLTKVFTGMEKTVKDAETLKSSLMEAGYAKPRVVSTLVSKEALESRAAPAAAPSSYGSKGVATPQPAVQQAVKPQQFDPDEMLFGVQVAAYSTKTNATKMMAKLRGLGFYPVYSADVGKSVRVFVGKFYFQSQAEAQKEKLNEAGIEGSSVRRVQ